MGECVLKTLQNKNWQNKEIIIEREKTLKIVGQFFVQI